MPIFWKCRITSMYKIQHFPWSPFLSDEIKLILDTPGLNKKPSWYYNSYSFWKTQLWTKLIIFGTPSMMVARWVYAPPSLMDHVVNCTYINYIYLTQLPGRLFSPSDLCKKLSHHFLLHFSIGMGSYDHHAKYQGVFPYLQ